MTLTVPSSIGTFQLNGDEITTPLARLPTHNPELQPAFVDLNIRETLKDPNLFEKYLAPERNFETINTILTHASGESLFPDGEKNARFLKIKSVIALRCATAFVVGDSKLKFSKVGKCTHLLETAAIALNMRATLPQIQNTSMTRQEAIEQACLPAYEFVQDKTVTDGQKREIIAFCAYGHDHLEEFLKKYPFMTAEYLVEHCWKPFCLPENKKYAGFVTYLLNQLTDPANSREWSHYKRLQLQLTRALADPSGYIGLIRDAEKCAMLARDNFAYEQNPSLWLLKKIRKNSKRRRHIMAQYPTAKILHYYDKILADLESRSPEVIEMREKRKFRKTTFRPESRHFRAQMTASGGSMGAPIL